jgi:hypothetical protein
MGEVQHPGDKATTDLWKDAVLKKRLPTEGTSFQGVPPSAPSGGCRRHELGRNHQWATYYYYYYIYTFWSLVWTILGGGCWLVPSRRERRLHHDRILELIWSILPSISCSRSSKASNGVVAIAAQLRAKTYWYKMSVHF